MRVVRRRGGGRAVSGVALVEELSGRGVKLWAEGGKLRCRGPRRAMTPETIARLKEQKAAVLEALEASEVSDFTAPPIENAGEVLELARTHFGLRPEDREEPPYPPPEKGRDPLVHRHTAKARFFRDVRERDQVRRAREGMPPWIRVADGGGTA